MATELQVARIYSYIFFDSVVSILSRYASTVFLTFFVLSSFKNVTSLYPNTYLFEMCILNDGVLGPHCGRKKMSFTFLRLVLSVEKIYFLAYSFYSPDT